MITASQLAKDLDLSVAAISQILNGKGSFAVATRERVLARAKEVDYRPNAVARATRTKRFGAIGFLTITPDSKGALSSGVLGSCLAEATTRGVTLITATTTDQDLLDRDLRPAVLRERMCDGLLLNYHLPPDPAIAAAAATCGVPLIWLNLQLPTACVHYADHQGAHDATTHLIELGHQRVAWVDLFHTTDHSLARSHYSAGARRAGYADACRAAGRTPWLAVPDERCDFAGRLAFLRVLLQGKQRPDAVICYQPNEALMVMQLASELGLSIPRDLSLVMFHNEPALCGWPVDTVLIPEHALGQRATAELLDAITAQRSDLPAIAIPMTSSWGATTCQR